MALNMDWTGTAKRPRFDEVGVPPGFVVVPIDATQAMCKAGAVAGRDPFYVYRAMINEAIAAERAKNRTADKSMGFLLTMFVVAYPIILFGGSIMIERLRDRGAKR